MTPAWKLALGEGLVAGTFASLEFTPERFTPGFQHRVSTPALVGAYTVFALGLALGSLAMRRSRSR